MPDTEQLNLLLERTLSLSLPGDYEPIGPGLLSAVPHLSYQGQYGQV